MLTIACPACGFCGGIEVFAADADARKFAQLMGQVPVPIADLVLKYLSLFAPKKHKLTFTRARARLEPLVPAITAGRITFAKRDWSAPLAVWEQALQTMIEQRPQLQLPLATHNYLYKIIVSIADKAEAAAENKLEADRRGGITREEFQASPGVQQHDDQARLNQQRVQALMCATSWINGQKRMSLPITSLGLRVELAKSQFTEDVIAFAIDRAGVANQERQL